MSFGGKEPFVFFSTITEARNDTVAFDYQWIDVRSFTSEALYAQSPSQLNRDLSNSELKSIARKKPGIVTANRLRFQLGKLRAIDLTYRYLRFNDSKINDFREPTRFVDDVGHEYGIAITNDFQLPKGIDLFLKGGAKWGRRTNSAQLFGSKKEDTQEYDAIVGLSRLLGEGKVTGEFGFKYQKWDPGFNFDSINTYSGHTVYQSRLFGLNRFIFNGTYVFQDVKASEFYPENDNMWSVNTQGTYVFPVPKFLFGNHIREGEIFGGYIKVVTLFASQDEVRKQEFFGGVAFRRIDLGQSLNPFDVVYRSSFFKSEVKDDPTQDNNQWRNQLTIGYRLIENPQVQWLPSKGSMIQPALLNLEVPLRHDGAEEGINDFANYRVGIQLKGDFIYTQTAVPFPFYATLGYAYEKLYHLNENFHILLFRLGTGF